jgi:predicted nucleic acid-binding Zn ribbon protein
VSQKDRKRRTDSPGRWAIQRERFQIGPQLPPHIQEDAVPLDTIVGKLLDKWGLDAEHWINHLASEWETIAGSSVCAHSRPGHLDNDQLTIFVDGSVWLHELKRYGYKTLLTNIAKHIGAEKVKRLRFALDPDGPRAASRSRQGRS